MTEETERARAGVVINGGELHLCWKADGRATQNGALPVHTTGKCQRLWPCPRMPLVIAGSDFAYRQQAFGIQHRLLPLGKMGHCTMAFRDCLRPQTQPSVMRSII